MGTIERPLRADAERNRRRILAAAAEVFAERGLHATMDEVAERAGVGVGTVYRRFPNRDELIHALFEARLEEFIVEAEQSLADPDPWQGLVGFLERTLALQAADRGLKDVMHSQMQTQHKLPRVRDRVVPILQQLLERAQAAGELRPDVALTDLSMISLMLGAVTDVTHADAPELWRRYLAFLLDGLRARREEPTPSPVPALDVDAFERAVTRLQAGRR